MGSINKKGIAWMYLWVQAAGIMIEKKKKILIGLSRIQA
jgi:hypothetical protein